MSTTRLPFLYPIFFRPIPRSLRPFVEQAAHSRKTFPRKGAASFHTSRCRYRPETAYQRYGTANEPRLDPRNESRSQNSSQEPSNVQPTLGATDTTGQAQQTPPQQTQEPRSQPQDTKTTTSSSAPAQSGSQQQQNPSRSSEEQQTSTDYASLTVPSSSSSSESAWQAQQWNLASQPPKHKGSGSNTALSTILNMEPPMSDGAAEEKPPHLQAPRYVHHFDTYTLVKQLKNEGGWNDDQAITLMKAVRASLADNMELAREGLVSKGDAEMESYLFRAACTELRTELRSTRQATADTVRTDRTTLQHESDLISQRISADTSTLKDELRGMMDDRKMAVRQDRRAMENRIQELNYRITLKLQSEVRSDVEGLRFVMTRRTVFALAVVVLTSLVILRFVSAAGGVEEAVAAKKEKKEREKSAEGSNEWRLGGGGAGSGEGESLG